MSAIYPNVSTLASNTQWDEWDSSKIKHIEENLNISTPCYDAKDGEELTVPVSQFEFSQLPAEIALETLLFLSVADLLKIRQMCTHYKTLIDTTPEIQVKIAHHYLQTMQSECNIPLDDLKLDLTNHKLSVEVNNNLCLWKLSQNSSSTIPQLSGTIHWISHLIVKDGKPKELMELFMQLFEQSNRLLTLYLWNCEVDSGAVEVLQSLQLSEARFPVLYLSDLKSMDCSFPATLSIPSSRLVMVEPNRADEYSIERFLTQESDQNALSELEQHVLDESFSGEQVLWKMKQLPQIIQARIVSSIWHSKLAEAAESRLCSNRFIWQQVEIFISKAPHHPAVRVAVRNLLIH